MSKDSFVSLLLVVGALFVSGAAAQERGAAASVKASAAYAEVLLRKTEALAEAEALRAEHTDESPRLVDLRYEIAGLDRYLGKMMALSASDTSRLSAALGKLIVKRMALDTDFARLSRTLNAQHTDYKRAKRRLEIFDSAVKEILP